MKKFLAILLMLTLLCTSFVACQGNEGEVTDVLSNPVDDAIDYIKAMYKKEAEVTAADFTRVSVVSIDGVQYKVVWTATVTAGTDPVAIVETVEPIVLGTKVSECNCPCPCGFGEYADIPEGIRNSMGDELVLNSTAPRLLVSFGIFSVIRIVRPAQLLVNATDYSVPDKECTAATNDDNPCSLFRTIAFPTTQFRGTDNVYKENNTGRSGGCGCGKN